MKCNQWRPGHGFSPFTCPGLDCKALDSEMASAPYFPLRALLDLEIPPKPISDSKKYNTSNSV